MEQLQKMKIDTANDSAVMSFASDASDSNCNIGGNKKIAEEFLDVK